MICSTMTVYLQSILWQADRSLLSSSIRDGKQISLLIISIQSNLKTDRNSSSGRKLFIMAKNLISQTEGSPINNCTHQTLKLLHIKAASKLHSRANCESETSLTVDVHCTTILQKNHSYWNKRAIFQSVPHNYQVTTYILM